ncbi:unnamed protein product [Prorocentrum cordatum]|uniref:Isochorismatase-like domain-containing protein n=1 Tax=Prorocentrum cordatum TaxID=2364126 RepID=A0ABN9W3H6_9DINO|nr:unnamed protein product [Polarella glacialis]
MGNAMATCCGDARISESPSEAKEGFAIGSNKTAMVAIEYQNELCSDGGKLHPAFKEVMASTGMLADTARVADVVRKTGAKVFHTPVVLKAEFCNTFEMIVIVIVKGKNGSDAFMGSDLEKQLKQHGIDTVVICGLFTSCCVESTIRTACEKGFNVVTLTNCTATSSSDGQKAAADLKI